MTWLLSHALTGLAGGSSRFLLAAGLTLIFGVSRVVNFAHGSLLMLGAYAGWLVFQFLPESPALFAAGVLLAAASVAAIGALAEMVVLRRVYPAPELLQLLATFGLVLIVQDLVLIGFGPAEHVIARAHWQRSFVTIGETRFPFYNLVLIATGIAVLALLFLLRRTRFGQLIRAASEDREMLGALGINQQWLFTGVFALGAGLAGLAGALALPVASANPQMDLQAVVDAFVIVVTGGLGSVTGAYLASVLLGLGQAFGSVWFPSASQVMPFAIMALVLVARPNGLLGRALPQTMPVAAALDSIRQLPMRPIWWGIAACAALLLPLVLGGYGIDVIIEMLIASLFAASLGLMLGQAGLASFGHAAWFGIGAYAASWASVGFGVPMVAAMAVAMLAAAVAAFGFGLLAVRLSGVYLAMLTLAFAEIVSGLLTQEVGLTGGDNGVLGVWPDVSKPVFCWLALGIGLAVLAWLRWLRETPFGVALAASRGHAARAEALGMPVARLRLAAIALSAAVAGLAGGMFAFAKGAVFPGYAGLGRSVDALVMVLLGGIGAASGPVVGAIAYTGLYDGLQAWLPYWRLVLGCLVLALVMAAPQGIAGLAARMRVR